MYNIVCFNRIMSSKFDPTLRTLMINHCFEVALECHDIQVQIFQVILFTNLHTRLMMIWCFVDDQPIQEMISGCFAPLNCVTIKLVHVPECTIRILVLFNHISSIEVAVDYYQ